jgi:hypothetical protein
MTTPPTPSPFIGLAPLMRQAFSGVDLKPLGTQLIERSMRDPDDAHTLMNLSTVLQLTGNREIALATQAQALEMQQIYRIAAAGGQENLRLLALMAPGDLMANTPLEFLLEDSDVTLDMLYLVPGMDALPELPDHDVMFVAIGESDENRPLLEQLQAVVEHWPRPVLNAPGRIACLSRDHACKLLQGAPGVAMPTSARVSRSWQAEPPRRTSPWKATAFRSSYGRSARMPDMVSIGWTMRPESKNTCGTCRRTNFMLPVLSTIAVRTGSSANTGSS